MRFIRAACSQGQPWTMTLPLIILATISIVAGFVPATTWSPGMAMACTPSTQLDGGRLERADCPGWASAWPRKCTKENELPDRMARFGGRPGRLPIAASTWTSSISSSPTRSSYRASASPLPSLTVASSMVSSTCWLRPLDRLHTACGAYRKGNLQMLALTKVRNPKIEKIKEMEIFSNILIYFGSSAAVDAHSVLALCRNGGIKAISVGP